MKNCPIGPFFIIDFHYAPYRAGVKGIDYGFTQIHPKTLLAIKKHYWLTHDARVVTLWPKRPIVAAANVVWIKV